MCLLKVYYLSTDTHMIERIRHLKKNLKSFDVLNSNVHNKCIFPPRNISILTNM